MGSDPLDGKIPSPVVVAFRQHGKFLPFLVLDVPVPKNAGNSVVAVGKNIRFDFNDFTNRPLDGKSSTLDFRSNSADHHAHS
jgi:hypothetical protein